MSLFDKNDRQRFTKFVETVAKLSAIGVNILKMIQIFVQLPL